MTEQQPTTGDDDVEGHRLRWGYAEGDQAGDDGL